MLSSTEAEWRELLDEALASSFVSDDGIYASISLLETLLAEAERVPRRPRAQREMLEKMRFSLLIELARLHLMVQEYSTTLSLLDRAAETGGLVSIHVRWYAFALHRLGRTDEAVEQLLELLRTPEDFPHMVTTDCFYDLIQMRQYETAQAWLEEARHQDPVHKLWTPEENRAYLFILEAGLRLEQGFHERSLVSADRAYKTEPGRATVAHLIESLVVLGRPNLALRLMNMLDETSVRFWHALALRDVGKTDLARAYFEVSAHRDTSRDDFVLQEGTLARLYLEEDPEYTAIELAQMLDEGVEMIEPIAFSLALVAARSPDEAWRVEPALQSVVRDKRRDLMGERLDRTQLYHARNLLPPALLEQHAHYFDPDLIPPQIL